MIHDGSKLIVTGKIPENIYNHDNSIVCAGSCNNVDSDNSSNCQISNDCQASSFSSSVGATIIGTHPINNKHILIVKVLGVVILLLLLL